MRCQFILGRRNDGQTEALYRELFSALDQGKKVYLILPEQATFQHERNIEEQRMGRSLWNLEVTSLRRLAERFVLDNPLDTLGRSLLIYDLLAEKKNELSALDPGDISVGFIEDISAVLKEASMNGFSPEELASAAEHFDENETAGDLGAKLRDLALLKKAAEERGLDDESGRLFCFSDVITEEKLFGDALFCFDEFFDFTAAEYEVLSALAGNGAEMCFAFLCDPRDAVFEKTNRAITRIFEIAQEKGLLVEKKILPYRQSGEPSLDYLEQHFFRRDGEVYEEECDAVTLVNAENKRAEIAFMAGQISILSEKGYAYHDIGVCFRDIGGYEKLIEDIFASYDIPCFLDRALPLSDHPVFRFCSGLLRVAEEKWSFPSVFSLLKSGLFPLDDHECDLFENYCLAHGIKGRRFTQEKDWTYLDEREGEDLDVINGIRRRVRDLLKPLVNRLEKAETAVDYAVVLWEFAEKSHCDRTVDRWREAEESSGRLKKSAELSAGVNAFGDMLDQLTAAFPDRVFTLSEFSELLKMGAASVSVRTIPSELDTVEVSVLGSSRLSRKKVIFLGGANEGVFPLGVSDGGFLNIADRTLLKAYTDRWIQDKDFYYESEDILTYQALTQATENLTVSYSESGGEGRALPSPVIAELEKMFPQCEKIAAKDNFSGEGFFCSLDEVLSALPLSLREKNGDWETVKNLLLSEENTAVRTDRLLRSLTYTGESRDLSPFSLERYPAKDLSLSVSSIERFRRCPFSYFARYGLGLKERKILQFAAPDIGNLFHETLCELMELMKKEKLPWENLRSVADDMIHDTVTEKLNTLSGDNLFPEEHLVYISYILSENLRFAVDMMAMQWDAGDRFVPAMWEVPFGVTEELAAYEIRVDDTHRIRLGGIIDRVDVAEKDGETYFRVVDYKSSDKDLTLSNIYHGTMPQLPVYTMVLERDQQDKKPAGIFYQSLKDAMIREDKVISDEDLRTMLTEEMAMKGYIIGDGVGETCYAQRKKPRILTMEEYDLVRDHTERKITAIGKDIFKGCTDIHPYVQGKHGSCDYCPYGAVCGYEAELMGQEERLPSLSDTVAKYQMGKGDEA